MSKKLLSAIARRMRPFALLVAWLLIPCLVTAQDPGPTSELPPESESGAIMPEVDSDGDLIPDDRDPCPLIANVPIYWSVQQFTLSRSSEAGRSPSGQAEGDGRTEFGQSWAATPSLVIAQVTTNPPAPSGVGRSLNGQPWTVMPLTSRKPAVALKTHPFAPLAVYGNDAIRLGALEHARVAAFLRGWGADGANTPIQLTFTVRFLNLDTRKWEMGHLEVPVTLGGKIWAMARVVPKKPGDNGLSLLVGDKVGKQDFVAEIEAPAVAAFLSRLVSSDFTPAFDFADASGLDPAASPDNPPEPGAYSLSAAFQSILLKTRQVRIEGPDGLIWTWRIATNDRRFGTPVTFGQMVADLNALSEQVYGAPLFAFDGTYPISIAGWDNGFWDLYLKVSRKGRDLNPSELLSSRFNADIVLALSTSSPLSLPAGGATPIISHLRGVLFYHAGMIEQAIECFTAAGQEGALQGYSWCGHCMMRMHDSASGGDGRTELQSAGGGIPNGLSGDSRTEFGQKAARLYKLAADAGYAPGLAWYGRIKMQSAEGAMQSPSEAGRSPSGQNKGGQEAVAALKKAADQGFAEGRFLYGLFLRNGVGVKPNKVEAMKLFEKAAWQGCHPAMAAYGDGLLESGSLEGRDWIELAAKAGDDKAAARFARFLRDGELGTAPDPAAAAKWLQIAAEAGDAPSLVSLGEALRAGAGVRRNPKKAAEYFRRAAEAGDSEGQTWYALCLLEGNGVRRDVPKALDFLARAADAGNASAKFFHGVCLFGGYGGTEPDKPAAMVRFKSAAAEQPAANVFLGVGYLNGLGLAKNEKKAVECFKAAADRDLPAGILWLAHCYANGIGVKKDLEEARKWARKAADLGVPAGRQMLLSIQE
jgi:TPR repeat protein